MIIVNIVNVLLLIMFLMGLKVLYGVITVKYSRYDYLIHVLVAIFLLFIIAANLLYWPIYLTFLA